MSDERDETMEDLTEVMTSGALTNLSDNALFKADDVKGEPLTLTIKGFKQRLFNKGTDKEETSWVMMFEEVKPGLKLNATNRVALFEIMGTNQIGDMIGRPVTLTYDPDVKFGTKKVGGVRLERAEESLV